MGENIGREKRGRESFETTFDTDAVGVLELTRFRTRNILFCTEKETEQERLRNSKLRLLQKKTENEGKINHRRFRKTT